MGAAPSPDGLAARVAATMYAADTVVRELLQIELLECGAGRARMRMRVREDMLNAHRICHGGLIFSLADTAFAYACNSRNQVAVAAGGSIEFLRPARPGDWLTCEAVEQVLQGRHGIYDMRVTNQHGELVALARGKSAQIAGTHVAVEE